MSDVASVAAETFEARIVKLEGERDARLTIDEARGRLLDAIDGARQANVCFGGFNGDLFDGLDERRMVQGVQVLALEDFNAALDAAFPDSNPSNQVGEEKGSK
jgi:hypothetical protein